MHFQVIMPRFLFMSLASPNSCIGHLRRARRDINLSTIILQKNGVQQIVQEEHPNKWNNFLVLIWFKGVDEQSWYRFDMTKNCH